MILAGRRNEGSLRHLFAGEYEALLPLAGRTMIGWVTGACLDARLIGDVVVVGPDPVQDSERALATAAERGRLKVVAPGADLMENVRRGIAALDQSAAGVERVLLITGDVPLISGPMLDRFLSACPEQADLCYPVVRRRDMEGRFPGAVRTYVRLRDGAFTGGNALLVRTASLDTALAWGQRLYGARKQPWRLAWMFGPGILWRVATRRATVDELEARLSALIGLAGRAIVTQDAEIALDVDKPADYRLVEEHLRERAGAEEGHHGTPQTE